VRFVAAGLAAKQAIDPRRASDADCCVFVRNVLRLVYGEQRIDAVPLWRWHLWAEEGAGPFEPVIAAVDAGIAMRTTGPQVGRWAIVQGWRGVPLAPGVTGHTFLWGQLDEAYGLQLDSTRTRGPRLSTWARWSEIVAPYRGGLAVGVLERPRRRDA
jgi:hypothetical protein